MCASVIACVDSSPVLDAILLHGAPETRADCSTPTGCTGQPGHSDLAEHELILKTDYLERWTIISAHGPWNFDLGPRNICFAPKDNPFISYPKHYNCPMADTTYPSLSDNLMNGSNTSPIKDHTQRLAAIGLVTRFGPDWPGLRCLAKTRRSTECQRPAITGSGRCRLHGGRSTGPRTQEGLARISGANLKHGRKTKERLAAAKARAQSVRETRYALKMQIELLIRDGYLPKNHRR